MFHTKDILWVTLVCMYDCMFLLYMKLYKIVRKHGNLQTCDDRIICANLQYFILIHCTILLNIVFFFVMFYDMFIM